MRLESVLNKLIRPFMEGRKEKLLLFLSLVMVSSCYRMFSTFAPERVEAGDTFECRFTVVDDGSNTQNFVNDWSYAGIRVPEGWTVTVPTGAHKQYAESWVYYENGIKVNLSHNMQASDKLTQFYNEACPKKGYKWHGFQSVKQLAKNISACWRNGADSISVTFLVTVPEGTAPGKYQIDFIGGDDEDAKGVEKYTSATEAKNGGRIFHAGTVNSSYIENKNTSLARTVEVVEDMDGIQAPHVSHVQSPSGTYDLYGRKVKTSNGIVIRDGKKIHAQKIQ